MWHTTLSRRDFVELCIDNAGALKANIGRSEVVEAEVNTGAVHAYWDTEPSPFNLLPSLIVVPDGEVNQLLTALLASPQSPSPLTSLCRVLTSSEVKENFFLSRNAVPRFCFAITICMALAEAMMLSDGRIGLRQLAPATCKRTLSYAWSKALAAGVSASVLAELFPRWLDVYSFIHSDESAFEVRRNASVVIRMLTTCTQIGLETIPDFEPGQLAYAIFKGDEALQENVWHSMSKRADAKVSLRQFATLNREARGMYLQEAIRHLDLNKGDESSVAACAFIATQVAPGSLEHLELLNSLRLPGLVLWYVLYASIQAPQQVLAIQNGLGHRILRDVTVLENLTSRPVADVAFSELKALERLGPDALLRKLGHTSEIEVELVPYVTASFTYPSRLARSRNEIAGRQMSLDAPGYMPPEPKHGNLLEKLDQATVLLNQISRELSGTSDSPSTPSHHRAKRK